MLNYITWSPDPVLFEIGSIAVRYYGLLWALTFYVGYFLGKKEFQNEGRDVKLMEPLLISVIVGAVLGARLGEVFFYQPEYFFTAEHWPEILLPIERVSELEGGGFKFSGFRGLASHGGVIGVALALFWYKTKKSKDSYLWILDKVAVPSAIGAFFIRMANFMNSEIVGHYTGTDYGVVFERLQETEPRHPAQLYEAIAYLVIFGILSYFYWIKKKYKQEGFLLGMLLVLLFTARFIVEFYKKSQGGFESLINGQLTTGQLLSIPAVLIGGYLLWRASKKAQEA